MFEFIGYNFYSDGNCLDNAIGISDNISTTQLSNAVYDHLNITQKTNIPFSTEIPVDWQYDTILNADFNGDLGGGNVEAVLSQLDSVKVKFRKKGDYNWITLKEIEIQTFEDLTFTMKNYLCAGNTEYEFAFVPILEGNEGAYVISTVFSKFKGVFIGDKETVFKLFYDTNFTSGSRVQQVGSFEPFGRKYPILISNGEVNYATGSVTSAILNDDYDKTRIADNRAIVEKKKAILDYLTNHKAKVLKDANGNMWLVGITDKPQISYKNGSNMSIPQISFSWSEIGDVESQHDLYENNLVDCSEDEVRVIKWL